MNPKLKVLGFREFFLSLLFQDMHKTKPSHQYCRTPATFNYCQSVKVISGTSTNLQFNSPIRSQFGSTLCSSPDKDVCNSMQPIGKRMYQKRGSTTRSLATNDRFVQWSLKVLHLGSLYRKADTNKFSANCWHQEEAKSLTEAWDKWLCYILTCWGFFKTTWTSNKCKRILNYANYRCEAHQGIWYSTSREFLPLITNLVLS